VLCRMCCNRLKEAPLTHRVLVLALVVGSISLSPAVRAAPAQTPEYLLDPRAMMVIAHIVQAVNLTDNQQAAIKKIAEAHKDDALAARDRGDVATLRRIVRDAAYEAADVLTPPQRAIAKDEIKKALAEHGLSVPALESFLR
jgi:hypothetical protein